VWYLCFEKIYKLCLSYKFFMSYISENLNARARVCVCMCVRAGVGVCVCVCH
jgi:hypothetical protein